MWRHPDTARIVAFLENVGIPVRPQALTHPTFLPGLTLHNGVILADESKLHHPGDLLHEAGHFAVLTPAERLSIAETFHPEGGYELAAIAWSYAAAVAIGLDPAIVFHEFGYKGEASWLLENFQEGNYLGLPMLQWLGLAESTGPTPYPQMRRWLRE